MKLHKNYSHYGKYLLLTDVSSILALLCLFHCSFFVWSTFWRYSEYPSLLSILPVTVPIAFPADSYKQLSYILLPDIWLIYFSEISVFTL